MNMEYPHDVKHVGAREASAEKIGVTSKMMGAFEKQLEEQRAELDAREIEEQTGPLPEDRRRALNALVAGDVEGLLKADVLERAQTYRTFIPLRPNEHEAIKEMDAQGRQEWVKANITARERLARILELEGLMKLAYNARTGRYNNDDGKARLVLELKRELHFTMARVAEEGCFHTEPAGMRFESQPKPDDDTDELEVEVDLDE